METAASGGDGGKGKNGSGKSSKGKSDAEDGSGKSSGSKGKSSAGKGKGGKSGGKSGDLNEDVSVMVIYSRCACMRAYTLYLLSSIVHPNSARVWEWKSTVTSPRWKFTNRPLFDLKSTRPIR